jgi:hypothetical protein
MDIETTFREKLGREEAGFFRDSTVIPGEIDCKECPIEFQQWYLAEHDNL